MTARLLPTLPTFAPGPLTSTQLTALATYQAFWANPPSFRAEQHTTQNVPSASNTQITCETVIHDSDSGLAAGTPFSYVVPFTGVWNFFGGVSVASNASGFRAPALWQNGGNINGSQPQYAPTSSVSATLVMAPGVLCTVGDVIGLYIDQNSGSTLATIVTLGQCSWFSGQLVSLQTP